MMVSVIILLVGLAILGGGLFYLVKEKADKESRKIYGVVSAVGAVILIVGILKLTVFPG